MFASWRIARLFGIDLFIHWTFWLLPLWVTFFNWDGKEFFSLWMRLLVIAALFVCVVLHELGHALTAREFGIPTHRIVLSPLGGIAQLERISQKPWEEFCIAIAGPLVNVMIAALLGIMMLAGYFVFADAMQTMMWEFLSVLLGLNVIMVVFNMLPAFPMDGGRVLRAMLAGALGILPGTRIAVAVGTVMAAFIGIGGMLYFGNPILLLIGLFVVLAGHQELRVLEAEARDREAADQEPLPAILVPPARHPRPTMHVTVCVWDPERHAWVRQSYTRSADDDRVRHSEH